MINKIKRIISFGNKNPLQNEMDILLSDTSLPVNAGENSAAYERIICAQLLSGSTMLEAIRDAQLRSSQTLHNEQKTIDELNSSNDEAKTALHHLKQIISEISAGADHSTASMTEFTHSLNEVSECVTAIQKISNQTNLIAINSAIEAAHVGIDGRGFSVIAKEIKTLSHDVQTSAANIFEIIKVIEQKSHKVHTTMSAQIPLVTQVNKDIAGTIELIERVIHRSAKMQDIIKYISLLQFLNTVKLDHVIWKFQVYHLLYQQETSYHLSACTECRLGKWYYEGEGRAFSHFEAFSALEAPHKAVHTSGREALESFLSGDLDAMTAALADMEQASQRVVLLIDRLVENITPQEQLH